MTPTAYVGSNMAAILDELTTAMGVENKLGEEEEVRKGAPPRVVWVPVPHGGRGYNREAPAQQRRDLKHVHVLSVAFTVHLWGKDYFAAEELEIALGKALYERFSQNGYELGPSGDQLGGDAQSKGFEFVLSVRLLRIPLPVELRPSVTLTGATATGTVADPEGNTPAIAGILSVTL